MDCKLHFGRAQCFFIIKIEFLSIYGDSKVEIKGSNHSRTSMVQNIIKKIVFFPLKKIMETVSSVQLQVIPLEFLD